MSAIEHQTGLSKPPIIQPFRRTFEGRPAVENIACCKVSGKDLVELFFQCLGVERLDDIIADARLQRS
jgi:hypothetical protein